MRIGIDIYTTLALAAAALVIGRLLVARVHFLAAYSIPDAVVGGMLYAAILTLLRGVGGVEVSFDPALLTPLNVAFFTTVGLSADARMLAKGGRVLLIFFCVVAGSLVMQDAIGVLLARAFDIHPLNGLLAGSITLAGGHGTGAAWAGKFAEEWNLRGAFELAVATATFGLVVGGLLGGPFAGWLMRRHALTGGAAPQAPATPQAAVGEEQVSLNALIESLLLIFASMAAGLALYRLLGKGAFTLPSFIWALLVGAVLRNVLSFSGLYRVSDRAVELLGEISLSLFLSMIIMTLKLWELVDLAGPVLVILVAQTVAMLAYVRFVTFRVMGGNYDAVLLATGHLGFAMGSTATAMVNVQSVAQRFGYSQLAFLLVPVMGAFLIDLANALTIQGFLALPWFNW